MNFKRILAVALPLLLLSAFLLNAELKDPSNQADYLVITHGDFTEEMRDLEIWRESKGLEVFTADLEQINAEFADTSEKQNEVIRNFISYALTKWQKPAPKYLLLAGSVSHIPAWKVQSQFHDNDDFNEDSVSFDYLYSVNKNEKDHLPDIALGRFPARNREDMRNMIDKTIRFEDKLSKDDYEYEMLFLIAGDDYSMFNKSTDDILEIFKNEPKYKKLTNDPEYEHYADKSEMIDEMSGNSRMLFNMHQGNPYIWFRSSSIKIEDVGDITGNKPFIRFSYASRQSFDDSTDYYITDKLMALKGGGSVSALFYPGITYFQTLDMMIREFLTYSVERENLTIGEAFLHVKNKYYDTPPRYLKNMFSLLGDPALELPVATIMSVASEMNDNINLRTYPNPFNESLNIEISADMGKVLSIKIVDQNGKPVKKLNPKNSNIVWQPEDISNGIYYVLVKTEQQNTVGKVIFRR